MKTLLTIFLLLSLESYSQSNFLSCDYSGHRPSYYKLIKEPSTQEDLFQRAIAYSLKFFPQSEKLNNNTIISRGFFIAYDGKKEWGRVNYCMTLTCYNGSYTYLINGFYHEANGYVWQMDNENKKSKGHSATDYDLLRKQTISHVTMLTNSLYFELQSTAINEVE